MSYEFDHLLLNDFLFDKSQSFTEGSSTETLIINVSFFIIKASPFWVVAGGVSSQGSIVVDISMFVWSKGVHDVW